MKKNAITSILVFLIISFHTFGQSYTINTDIKESIQEKVVVHYNTSLLLNGERFLYKIYCLNNKNNEVSNFSKIAYLELVSKDKVSVLKNKIRLESGVGQGDFFIPANLHSGNYKLIAYTNWMRNNGVNSFFESDITIINPFQSNHETIRKDSNNIHNLTKKEWITSNIKDSSINIKLNKKEFKNREKVSLTINIQKEEYLNGNYSISVKKMDSLHGSSYRIIDNSISSSSLPKQSKKDNTVNFLPEYRGELISGRVLFKESKEPVANKKVVLSIPGKNYILKIATTNKYGVFYYNIIKEYEGSHAVFQVLDNEKEKYEIILDEDVPIDYNSLTYSNYLFSVKDKDQIIQRSIYNQIENSYSSLKLDNIDNLKIVNSFYGKQAQDYLLDDYTRFPTLKETVIEVVKRLSITKNKGLYGFNILVKDGFNHKRNSPVLVILDGIYIEDHNSIMDFNASVIKKISVIDKDYVYGGKLFQGILFIETMDKKFINDEISNKKEGVLNIKLSKPISQKKYFNQIYDDSNILDRIPDYRSQLLWEPDLNLNKEQTKLTFYTSDNNGYYEISIKGYTMTGIPVSVKGVIKVE